MRKWWKTKKHGLQRSQTESSLGTLCLWIGIVLLAVIAVYMTGYIEPLS